MDLKRYDELVTPTFDASVTTAMFEKELLNRTFHQSLEDEELSHAVNAFSVILDQCVELLDRAEVLRNSSIVDKDISDDVSYASVLTAKIDYAKMIMNVSSQVARFLEVCIDNEVYVEGSDVALASIQTLLEKYHTMEEEYESWRNGGDGRN